MTWPQETLDAFNTFREACDDFMNATNATNLRTAAEAGNITEVVTQWDQLGLAVGDLFDHLDDKKAATGANTR